MTDDLLMWPTSQHLRSLRSTAGFNTYIMSFAEGLIGVNECVVYGWLSVIVLRNETFIREGYELGCEAYFLSCEALVQSG